MAGDWSLGIYSYKFFFFFFFFSNFQLSTAPLSRHQPPGPSYRYARQSSRINVVCRTRRVGETRRFDRAANAVDSEHLAQAQGMGQEGDSPPGWTRRRQAD